jgi:hypothetical protein
MRRGSISKWKFLKEKSFDVSIMPLFEAGYPRVTHPSAANHRFRRSESSLDLHVLGTPPAFVLSQDQTLNLKVYTFSLK